MSAALPFLLLAQSHGQGAAAGDSVLKQHYDAAQQAQGAGNFAEAARQYRIFLADGLAEIAIASVSADQYSKAAPLFDEALLLAPNSPGLKIRYALAALAANDPSRARTLSEGVVKDYPGNTKALARAHLVLGRALSRMNQEEAARSHFEEAVRLEPNFENGYALAIACLDLNDGPEAEKVFAEMVQGLGDVASLHIEIGRAYLNSDFQPKAAPEFERAIALDPKLPGAHYSLAVALLTMGGDNRLTVAKRELEAELKLSPNDASTHAQLGNLALQERRYEDAERELKQAETLDAADPNAPFYLGQVYAETARPPAAMVSFRQSIALTKDPAYNRYQVQKVHYQLGRLLMQAGQTVDGRNEMKLAAELQKLSLGRDRERLASELDHTAANPDTPVITVAATSARTEATAALEKVEAQLAPALADSYNNLGAIAAGDNDAAGALTDFERAYEWNPRLPGLDTNWGLAAYRAGQFADAVAPLGRALATAPGDAGVRAQLGVSLYKTGDYARTLLTLGPMGAQVEGTPLLAFVWASSLVRTGREAEGLKQLQGLEVANPKVAEVHEELVLAYRKTHKDAEAAREQGLLDELRR